MVRSHLNMYLFELVVSRSMEFPVIEKANYYDYQPTWYQRLDPKSPEATKKASFESSWLCIQGKGWSLAQPVLSVC